MLLLATLGAVTLAANTLGSTRQVPEFFPRLRIPYAPASFSSSHRGAAAVTILVGFKGVCGDSTRVQYHSRIPGYTHGARGPLYGSQTTLSTNRTFSVRLCSFKHAMAPWFSELLCVVPCMVPGRDGGPSSNRPDKLSAFLSLR